MRSLIARSISSQMSASLRRSWPFRDGINSRDCGAVSHSSLFAGALTVAIVGASSLLNAPVASAQSVAPKATASKGPVVSIVNPQYSDQLKGTVQVLVSIEARQFTPQSIEMLVDGRSATDGAIKLESFPSANFTWDTTRFPDGPHRLTVVVTDTQGFRGSSDVNVYINNGLTRDALAPDLAWLNVKSGDTWRGIVDLNLKVVDNFGVKYLFVMLNPAAEPLKKPAAFSWFLNRPPYTVRFDSRNAADGQYTLRALAYDALENEGVSPSVNINIANRSINPTYIAPNLQANKSNAPGNALQAPQLSPIPVTPQPQATDSLGENDPIVADSSAPEAPTAAPQASAPVNGANRIARNNTRNSVVAPTLSQPNFAARGGAPANPMMTSPRSETQRPALAGGRLNPNEAIARANPRVSPSAGEIETSRVTSSSEGSRAASVSARPTARTANGKSALPVTVPRVAAAGTASKKVSVPATVDLAPMKTVQSRIGSAREAQAQRGQVEQRLAAIDAAERAVARGVATSTPSLSASVTNTRDGSIAVGSPQKGVNGQTSAAQNGKFVRPEASERVAKPRLAARNTEKSTSLAPANLAALKTRASSVSGSAATVGQGSVVAPLFPNPSLNKSAKAQAAPQRVAPPLLAALPAPSIARGVSRAAITVTPAATSIVGALPKVHRVVAGQTLGAVAVQYKLPVDVLAVHNNIDANAPLKTGQSIDLPQTLAISFAGQPVTGDVAAMMVGSTGVTPFRFLFEKQGGTLKWDEKKGLVTARNATHEVTLAIGSKSAMVNKKEVMLDLAAFLVSGRTMVPIRFFEKALQARVEWEPATGRLFVAMKN